MKTFIRSRAALASAALALAVGLPASANTASSPSLAAQSDAASINASLNGLSNPRAAAYVAYALNHQVQPCVAEWPYGIQPTVPMVDKFYSGCWLLKDPTLSSADIAYILSHISNLTNP